MNRATAVATSIGRFCKSYWRDKWTIDSIIKKKPVRAELFWNCISSSYTTHPAARHSIVFARHRWSLSVAKVPQFHLVPRQTGSAFSQNYSTHSKCTCSAVPVLSPTTSLLRAFHRIDHSPFQLGSDCWWIALPIRLSHTTLMSLNRARIFFAFFWLPPPILYITSSHKIFIRVMHN
jgi:hypothetical protein